MSSFAFLLFDADDTLFDFRAAEVQAFRETMEQHGIEYSDEKLKLYHDINDALWKRIELGEITNPEMQLRRFTEFLQQIGTSGDGVAMNAAYIENLGGASILFDGALELVQKCAKDHTLAIITNGIESVQRRRFAASGLAPYFKHVFISGVIGYAKPSPLFFDQVCREMGIDNRADALIIGDSLSSDILGGNNAGIQTCWYRGGFGWVESGDAPKLAKPDYTVGDYTELEKLLNL